jgi:hypothetical protein
MFKIETLEYHFSQSSFLFTKKIDSFNIVRKINDLVYELKLSISMKIHSVIFIIHLEQALENKFDRIISMISDLILMKEHEK